jgi:hypothetical protein
MPNIEAATTAPETAIAQSLPVVYRQEAQPRAAMVNAVLPLHKSHRAARKSSRGIQPHGNAHITRLNRPPRIVLTTVELPNYGPSSSAGGAYIQPIRFSPSYYAAVPFGDGWLVIQL